MPRSTRHDSADDENQSKRRKKVHRPGAKADQGAINDPDIAPSKALELDLRTLMLLSMGDWSELADLEWPPQKIRKWLSKTDIRQVRGMLLMTLDRWHELRQPSPPEK
jgi:hypothetical protein